MEDKWDAKVLCALEENELTFMVMVGEYMDYENDQNVDLGCSNHMTGDQRKLQDKD